MFVLLSIYHNPQSSLQVSGFRFFCFTFLLICKPLGTRKKPLLCVAKYIIAYSQNRKWMATPQLVTSCQDDLKPSQPPAWEAAIVQKLQVTWWSPLGHRNAVQFLCHFAPVKQSWSSP